METVVIVSFEIITFMKKQGTKNKFVAGYMMHLLYKNINNPSRQQVYLF